MASAPVKSIDLIDLVRKSGLADDRLDNWLENNPDLPSQVNAVASKMVQDGLITTFHVKHMLTGKYKGFVLGQYKVLDQIGAGGMGVIFLAEHLSMKRRVAIKVLPPDKASDEESLERFYREARIVAALDHPNVVHAFDVDKSGDTHFMVMEYIEGESLEQILRRKGAVPMRDAADLIAQAARGLQHANERGLVHRDIKPGNLFVDKTGVLKVLDMGLARFFEENSNLTTELCSGSVIGTADYMAPEQAVNSHDVDIRADIYSLGVTFYALLTGQPPYANLTVAQKLLAHHMREPAPVRNVRPDVPDELAEVVMTMMAKKPEHRYQTPGEVDDVLTDWIKRYDTSAAPTAKSDKTIICRRSEKQPQAKKNRWVIPASVGGGVFILIILIAVAALGGKTETPVTKQTNDPPAHVVADAKQQLPAVHKDVPRKSKNGEIRRFDTKGDSGIDRVAFSPDDKMIAGGSRATGMLRIWNVESPQVVKEFKAMNGPIHFVAYSHSGKMIAVAGQEGAGGVVKIWNTTDWTEKKGESMSIPKGAIRSAVFSPDGKTIFAGCDDGLGRFWSVDTGKLLQTCEKPHERDVKVKESIVKEAKEINWVAWAPNGQLVYSAGWDGSLRAWDAATGKQAFVYDVDRNRYHTVAVTDDSGYLLCSTDSPGMLLLNARTGARIRPFSETDIGSQWCGMFSKDGKLAVSSGSSTEKPPKVRLWDVGTGSIIKPFLGHGDQVFSCAISADGRRIVSTSKDATVRLWEVER